MIFSKVNKIQNLHYLINYSYTFVFSHQVILIVLSIRRDQVAEVPLLILQCHLNLTSKHFLLVGLASKIISHYIYFPSINMKVTTQGWIACFANMELDTLGGAKLQPLHCRLGIDELVHEVVPTGSDGEQVIDETQRWYGDQVLVEVEVLGLLKTLLAHSVDLQAGDERGKDIPLHDNLIQGFSLCYSTKTTSVTLL